jgi:hypothetical protein
VGVVCVLTSLRGRMAGRAGVFTVALDPALTFPPALKFPRLTSLRDGVLGCVLTSGAPGRVEPAGT